jgi:peptide/nickel transport system substrate-binding protein
LRRSGEGASGQIRPTLAKRSWLATAALCIWITSLGCNQAPAANSLNPESGQPRAVKTLRVGRTQEPKDGILFGGTSTGAQDPALTFHAGLTVYDDQANLLPRLAQKVPTTEEGDWRVGPDGQMEIDWHLRPNIRWHDGTPLTVEDFQLGLRVIQDNDVPIRRGRWVGFVSEIRPLGDQAFTVVWRQPYILANASGPSDLAPLPNRILGSLYDAGDKQAFSNLPYWTQEFVGLGPYRIREWVPGSHITALAEDGYFLGRPKIDEIVFRYFTDVPPLVAAALAGEVDVIPVGALKAEEAVTLKRAWESSGRGTVIISLNGLRVLYFQYRDPIAPWVRDVRVRQALVHMQDRQTLVETLKGGLTHVGDTLPTPDDSLYRLVEQRGLTRYPYDPGRAAALMTEAGWTRGPGGTYQNAAGQPFTIEVRTVVVAPEALQEILAVSDQFKAAALESPIYQIRQGQADSSELRAKAEGVFATRLDDTPDALSRFHSSLIASESNRWLGQNVWGYSNQIFDRMYDEYIVTLDMGKRQGLLADMLKMAADEAIFMPMWYELGLLNSAYRSGVRGPGPVKTIQQESTWNIHDWDVES